MNLERNYELKRVLLFSLCILVLSGLVGCRETEITVKSEFGGKYNEYSLLIYIYSGENGSARKFAKEMISSGTVDAIRNEAGNIRYDYFFPLGDEETVLLIDSWENQESIDFHHQSPMINKIAELRDKYNLHMKVERYRSEDTIPDTDQKYIRN